MSRDSTVDTLRGLAIVTMIAANLAPSALAAPHPLGVRLFGTFAAPLFVFLAGMMVALAARRGATLGHFLARGVWLVIFASAMEITGGSFPLVSVDVLYLLGVAMPIAYAALRLPTTARLALPIAVFAATPWLQQWRYRGEIEHVELARGWDAFVAHLPTTADNWLVNGYFPLMPWLGFALLGACVGALRYRDESPRSFTETKTAAIAAACLAIGIAAWTLFPGPLYVRKGYSEMFYPAMPGYIITSIGVIAVLLFVVDLRPRFAGARWLQVLGASSLFVYIGHMTVIFFAVDALVDPGSLGEYAALYVALLALMSLACVGITRVKPRAKRWPLPLRMLVGA